MALNMRISVTSGVSATEVPEDVAVDLQEAYEALAALPVNRQIDVDFDTDKEAREFVRQGKAWAAAQEIPVTDDEGKPVNGPDGKPLVTPLTFARKGNVKSNPTRVSFRIYVPRVK